MGSMAMMGVGQSEVAAATNRLLLETGDYILMENSDFIAQE